MNEEQNKLNVKHQSSTTDEMALQEIRLTISKDVAAALIASGVKPTLLDNEDMLVVFKYMLFDRDALLRENIELHNMKRNDQNDCPGGIYGD